MLLRNFRTESISCGTSLLELMISPSSPRARTLTGPCRTGSRSLGAPRRSLSPGPHSYNHRIRIELEDKAKVVASDWGTEQNPCRASCFASVFLKQTVEFNHPPCLASCFGSVLLKQTVEFHSLFQKDRGKTASAARILFLIRCDDLCLVF